MVIRLIILGIIAMCALIPVSILASSDEIPDWVKFNAKEYVGSRVSLRVERAQLASKSLARLKPLYYSKKEQLLGAVDVYGLESSRDIYQIPDKFSYRVTMLGHGRPSSTSGNKDLRRFKRAGNGPWLAFNAIPYLCDV